MSGRRSRGCSTRTRGRTACALCVRVRTMSATLPKEGKIELRAECDGLFRVDVERLYAVNSQEELMIATRHTNTPVKKGDKLAGMRVIPLVIAEEKVQAAEAAVGAGGPILSLHPYVCKTCGLVVTGSEVQKGLIADQFSPVVKDKLAQYGISVILERTPGDDRRAITQAVLDFQAAGVDLILCTGGMSVDPDDRHPRRHQGHWGGHCRLRRAGAAWGHVPAQLPEGHPGVRPARLP